MMTKREARKAGRERGLAAASWVFDGNTTDTAYRAVLQGIIDGDPAVLDQVSAPDWLSGEWAGESITELLGESSGNDERDDEVADVYVEAAETAYWNTVERTARRMVSA